MAKIVTTVVKGIKQAWYTKLIGCKVVNKGTVCAYFGFFNSAEDAKGTGEECAKNAIETKNVYFTHIPENGDIAKQAYVKLSELDVFKDAEDC